MYKFFSYKYCVNNRRAFVGTYNVTGKDMTMNGSQTIPQQKTYSFYKRDLKDPAVAFSSTLGKQIFREALEQGTMEGFFKLIEQFRTQEEPAFCGLTSLCIVLNALSIDPRRNWKGVWRWFSEGMLDCCKDLEVVEKEGVSMHQVACLASCNGAVAETKYYGEFDEQQFRAEVAHCTKYADSHIVISYSRKDLSQTGDGHFSPIGGYNEERDLVLILDTACFKYPPHWVPLSTLYKAMEAMDKDTNKSRGYIKITAKPRLASLLYTLNINHHNFWKITNKIVKEIPQPSQQVNVDLQIEEWLQQLCDRIDLQDVDEIVMIRNTSCISQTQNNCSPLQEGQRQLLTDISQLQIYQILLYICSTGPEVVNKLVILLVEIFFQSNSLVRNVWVF
eukprot:TRINITY_DN29057_c0_g1_i8.p1 TRINITY_DN29057_c0_g1~~TRINITY_DN29057_c0_g1_i8.p1  ORF type:complete len:391 (+),score=15.79 TRINITY_DN29057_c0_g1_i8:214-1386(+)